MTFWQHFFWLGEMAFDVSPLGLPLVFVLLLVWLGGQLWLGSLSESGVWPRGVAIAQALVSPTILALGVLGACENCSPSLLGQGVTAAPWRRGLRDSRWT